MLWIKEESFDALAEILWIPLECKAKVDLFSSPDTSIMASKDWKDDSSKGNEIPLEIIKES